MYTNEEREHARELVDTFLSSDCYVIQTEFFPSGVLRECLDRISRERRTTLDPQTVNEVVSTVALSDLLGDIGGSVNVCFYWDYDVLAIDLATRHTPKVGCISYLPSSFIRDVILHLHHESVPIRTYMPTEEEAILAANRFVRDRLYSNSCRRWS